MVCLCMDVMAVMCEEFIDLKKTKKRGNVKFGMCVCNLKPETPYVLSQVDKLL